MCSSFVSPTPSLPCLRNFHLFFSLSSILFRFNWQETRSVTCRRSPLRHLKVRAVCHLLDCIFTWVSRRLPAVNPHMDPLYSFRHTWTWSIHLEFLCSLTWDLMLLTQNHLISYNILNVLHGKYQNILFFKKQFLYTWGWSDFPNITYIIDQLGVQWWMFHFDGS